MERLTERFDGWVMRKGCHGPCRTCHRVECADIHPTIDRLADYEDAMPLERAQELAQAEKDGRLVVLPCKVGDTAWFISRAHKTISQYTVAGYLNDGFRWKVRMTKTIPSWVGNQTEHKYSVFNSFGKTVFLTRGEAEAALKKMREADNAKD